MFETTTSTQTTFRGVRDGAITVHRGQEGCTEHEFIRILKRYVAPREPLAPQPQSRILP